jgi:serine/threonine protein kinase
VPLFPPALYYFVRSARILAWRLFPDEAAQDVHDPKLTRINPALPALLTSVLTWECAVLSEIPFGGPSTIVDLLFFGGPVIVSAIAWWEIHELRRPGTERHRGEVHVARNGETVVSGRYRLVEVLGEGAMGAVWRAHDTRMRQDVVLKQLKPPLGLEAALRQDLMARMERESQAVGMLKHPGIVTVYDQFRDKDGLLWIAMELLRGRSLADVITNEGRLDEARVARIGAQIAAALAAAHQARIVHRDINPFNILLQDQRVVVTDFGIPAVAGDITLTAGGALLGIHAYTAPEQVNDHQPTAACDIWSLGATLYTAVEGRPAFIGTTNAALLRAVSQGNPAPMRHAQRLVPVLADLMRFDARRRPTAQAAATALTAL